MSESSFSDTDMKSPDRETQVAIDNGRVPEGYELITWPESQDLMGEGGPIGEGKAILVNSGPLYEQHGDVCFLIPEETLYETYSVTHTQIVTEEARRHVDAKSKEDALRKVKDEGMGDLMNTKYTGWVEDQFDDVDVEKVE